MGYHETKSKLSRRELLLFAGVAITAITTEIIVSELPTSEQEKAWKMLINPQSGKKHIDIMVVNDKVNIRDFPRTSAEKGLPEGRIIGKLKKGTIVKGAIEWPGVDISPVPKLRNDGWIAIIFKDEDYEFKAGFIANDPSLISHLPAKK